MEPAHARVFAPHLSQRTSMQTITDNSGKHAIRDDTPLPELFTNDDIESLPRPVTARSEEEPPFVTVKRDYPRVANAIEMTWGHRELEDYLRKLIMPDRGDREGFPKPVLAALLKLYRQHTTQFSFAQATDAWVEERNKKNMHSLGPQIQDAWADDPMAKHTHREGKHFRHD
jgi:hypothetical protein